MILENNEELDGILNGMIRIYPEQAETCRAFSLHCLPSRAAQPSMLGVSSTWRFVVQETGQEHRRREFDSFAQVMNYLLDELMGRQTGLEQTEGNWQNS